MSDGTRSAVIGPERRLRDVANPDVATRKAIAKLWDPGWLTIGEPDVSARIAERGADYDATDLHSVDEWDWQRRIPVRLIDGTTRIFESPPNGAMHVLVPEQD